MSNDCHQLAYGERCQIQVLLSSGKSRREIAKLLNRDPGTISRELNTIIVARHRGALLSSVDRVSRYALIEWLEGKTSKAVSEAPIRRMHPLRDRVPTCSFVDREWPFAGSCTARQSRI